MDSHVVQIEDGPDVFLLIAISFMKLPVLLFLGLKERGISVLYPERTFATADHNTPTINQHLPVEDPLSANQLRALEENSKEYGISHWGLETKKWNRSCRVLKTELHYLALLLFAEIHILPPTVPLCHCFGIGT
jgi:homoaconitase/3-isopropylmalate dehydratase large subunit